MITVRWRLVSILSALALVLTLFTLLPEGALKAQAETERYATSVTINDKEATVYNDSSDKYRIYEINFKMPDHLTEIDTINFNVTEPYPGAHPSDVNSVTTNQPGVEILDLKWADNDNMVKLPDDIFEADKIYRAVIRFKIQNGHKLASNYTVKINGHSGAITGTTSDGNMFAEYSFVPTEITNIAFTVPEPYPSAHPSDVYSVTTNQPGVEIVKLRWTDDNDMDKLPDDIFEAGKKYIANIEFKPKYRYEFASNLKVTVNGKKAYVGSVYNGNRYAEVEFTCEDATYKKGDVNHDGEVDRIDANLLSRYVAGWDGYESKIFKDCADLNGDGNVDRIDANILSRCVADWDGYREKYIK